MGIRNSQVRLILRTDFSTPQLYPANEIYGLGGATLLSHTEFLNPQLPNRRRTA